MRTCAWGLFACCLAVVIGGCDSGKERPASDGNELRAEDLVGKWRLVRAGGKPPAEVWIKSQEIDLAPDGKWTSKIEGTGFLDKMTVKGGGTWSLADGVITRTNGTDTVKSRVKLEAGRLIVDPDCFWAIRKKGPAVVGEYER